MLRTNEEISFSDSFTETLKESIEHVAGIAYNGDIRHFHHRGLRVFIDSNNKIRFAHACCMLNCATYPKRKEFSV